MSCNCNTYTCLNVVQQYSNCPEIVTLDLASTETATYTWQYEFNGLWKGGNIDVESGENIVLPYVFNENYTHLIKIYKTDGTLLNSTCYKLNTSQLAGSYNTGASTSTDNHINVELTEDMLSNNNKTVTLSSIASRAIVFIADGNQLYNFASFTQDGDSFTMINGSNFYVGQKITILF